MTVKVKRERIEEKLDQTITENRTTIAIIFPIVGFLMIISSAEVSFLPNIIKFNAILILFGVFVMRLPLISGLLPITDKKSVILISLLIIYTYSIEIIGINTGLPYGNFEYGVNLGPMFMDVPIALPLFFIPLVFNAYLLCINLFEFSSNRFLRYIIIIIIVVVIDMVLDPAAVSIGFWSYENGIYYGVPLLNYIGWILSASVATMFIDLSYDYDNIKYRLENCDYIMDDMVSFTILWGLINLYYMSIVPVILSIGFIIGLIKADKFNFVFLNG